MGTESSPRILRLLPWAALGLIAVLDAIQFSGPLPVVVTGLLDEPAHLLTALLALWALAPRDTSARAWLLALLGSVAIDVDHVPLYLTHGAFAVGGGRPPTHSLITLVVLTLLAFTSRRLRPLLPFAVGVGLHFLRDVATGPGIALFWPGDDGAVQLPYWAYATTVAALAALATARRPPNQLARSISANAPQMTGRSTGTTRSQ